MKVSVIANTSCDEINDKELFTKLGGKLAGICYMPNNFEALDHEDAQKTLKRANTTKSSGHHSVFEHSYITLYLEDVPKLFAMLLNNERAYTTSEKSARYTKMSVSGVEKELYEKWFDILQKEITKNYGGLPYFSEKRIAKLAQENARYFLSVFTPTSLAYTCSFRQLNYLYGWMKRIDEFASPLFKKLKPQAEQFCEYLEKLNLIDEDLVKGGDSRFFSIENKKFRKEFFSDCYSTKYEGSFSSFAQTQRHRTLIYELKQIEPPKYYVPKIIEKNDKLKSEWLDDMKKVEALTPQAQLVEIYERGTPENFLLKARERLCTAAQLEIMEQTKNTMQKFIEQTDDQEIQDEMKKHSKARCTSGYTCKEPCKFVDGINLEREI